MVPEDFEEKVAMSRGFQFSGWDNKTGLDGKWLASNDFDHWDVKNYYYNNFTKYYGETEMKVCFPIVVQNIDPMLICRTYTVEDLINMETRDISSWSSVYGRNKGRFEADVVVFSMIILFGTLGKCLFVFKKLILFWPVELSNTLVCFLFFGGLSCEGIFKTQNKTKHRVQSPSLNNGHLELLQLVNQQHKIPLFSFNVCIQ